MKPCYKLCGFLEKNTKNTFKSGQSAPKNNKGILLVYTVQVSREHLIIILIYCETLLAVHKGVIKVSKCRNMFDARPLRPISN